MSHEGEELLDYSDSEDIAVPQPAVPAAETDTKEAVGAADDLNGDEVLTIKQENGDKKGSYVGIHSTGFRDFLLKPELLRAISILGTDVVCQAKSGLGKTAVFVLATLQQIEPVDGEVSVVVLCHTRELAYQIKNEYSRFSKYLPDVRTAVFYGGTPTQKDVDLIKDKSKCPHIIVATPGRLNALVRDKHLRLGNVKTFVIDECDKVLEATGMFNASL
ncbi:hypothetical protein DV453_003778 [Geotrichum candidum]|nr:hypothetical protein DV453_003778 [Geotrichum candidum]